MTNRVIRVAVAGLPLSAKSTLIASLAPEGSYSKRRHYTKILLNIGSYTLCLMELHDVHKHIPHDLFLFTIDTTDVLSLDEAIQAYHRLTSTSKPSAICLTKTNISGLSRNSLNLAVDAPVFVINEECTFAEVLLSLLKSNSFDDDVDHGIGSCSCFCCNLM
ncbi:hypothetical protein P9112_006035 [Eukaryota sp. TZLM1-RC]